MESSNSNSKERELQLTQQLVKQRHSYCMTWFEQLKIHLRDLYLNNSSHALRLQLERENLYEVNAKTCLELLRTQFKEFFASKGVNLSDHLNQGWQQDFKEYTLCKPDTYRSDLVRNLDILEMVIRRAINPVQAVDASLVVTESSEIMSINNSSENALRKSVNETQMQMQEEKVDMGKALDVGLVVMESSGTKSDKQDTSSRSGNYTTHVVDAYIKPVNDQESFAEVQLTAQHNILANEQQHFE
ncbi:hypothetical protein Tco_1475500 [Tanacetum coccineum]